MAGRLLLQDRYELLERVDSGENSAIFRCIDTFESDRVIALKRIPEEEVADPDSFRALQREFLHLKKFASDMTLNVLDFINQGNVVGYTMDFLPGMSLQDQIDAHGRFSVDEALDYISQILEAVEALHSDGYIHSALDVSNILMARGSRLVLSEFSFMFEKGSNPEAFPGGKRREVIPPEYIDSRVLDERSDIYLVGVIAYQLITGRDPFSGINQFERIVNQLKGLSVAPYVVCQDVPLWLSEIVSKAMKVNPDQRFQSVGEFLQEVRRFL